MLDPKAMKLIPDLLESMNDSIIIDKDGTIIFFSESYAHDTGVNSKDVIGKNVKDVIANTRMHIVLKTGKEESGKAFYSILPNSSDKDAPVSSTPVHFCNRLPVRKGGRPDGEIIGAFAYTSLANPEDVTDMQKQLDFFQKQDLLYMNHLSEVYQPQFMLESIKGSSQEINHMRDIIKRVAPSDITVTVTGETGTGKELIASAIHELSPRNHAPFVKINCAAIPDNLMESELFGYEPGSFTGALKSGKIGKFELANHGTILLDEIGEMPLPLQAKLLRVLQEKEVERIGGKSSIPLDVRFICSTNRDLREMVNNGQFREDLFYRIIVMEIKAPPLRERLDDLRELCDFFVSKCISNGYAQISGVDPSVYELLCSYSWPGNVRELEHVIECACVMANAGVLGPAHFDFLKNRFSTGTDIMYAAADAAKKSDVNLFTETPSANHLTLRDQIASEEINLITNALLRNRGNISATAAQLNMNRGTLYRKIKKYGI